MSLVIARGLALAGRLHPTDLTLEAGTLTCLIGPNGSGKTSLLQALARVGGAAGSVSIGCEEIDTLPPARRTRTVSFLPTSRDLPWAIGVRDLVALSGADAAQVDEALERLDLGSFADRRADRLSTGERSRVLIARAVATHPRLLLLDEPTGNLDPLWQMRLMELLKNEVRDQQSAALVAMHDLDAAGRYADRLVVVHAGCVLADGEPREILGSPVIAQVFGIERAPEGWRAIVTPSADR